MKISEPLPRSIRPFNFIDSQGIEGFLNALEAENVELNSLMILVHGEVVFETWYEPYRPEIPHSMHSFTKGLTSTAIGFLVEEGRVTLDDPVISYFRDKAPESPSENLKKMKLSHLLTMTCGHEKEPPRNGISDYISNFLNWPVPYEPGTHFYYNSMGTYMLTAVLKKVTGQNLTQYLRPRLFGPLGIYDVTCDQCPMGVENGGGGCYLRTEDMAKVAQFYLKEGEWNGRQLISKEWIRQAVSVQFKDSYDHMFPYKEDWKCGYGYCFWRCSVPGLYRFDGSFGQFGIVIPQKDAVVVTTASDALPERILAAVWKYIVPAIGNGNDREGWERLRKNLSGLKMRWCRPEHLVSSCEGTMAEKISGVKLYFPPNSDSMIPKWRRDQKPQPSYVKFSEEGVKWCRLSFEQNTCYLDYSENGIRNKIQVGLNGNLKYGLLKSNYTDFPVAAAGSWNGDTQFRIDIRFITTAHHGIYSFSFKKENVVGLIMEETPFDFRVGTPKPRSYELSAAGKASKTIPQSGL